MSGETGVISFDFELPNCQGGQTLQLPRHEASVRLVRQSGPGSVVAVFHLTLLHQPLGSEQLVSVYIQESNVANAVMAQQGFKASLYHFTKMDATSGTCLQGFQLHLRDFVFHPLDSSPRAFEIALTRHLENCRSQEAGVDENEAGRTLCVLLSVPRPGIEPGSKASEALVLSIVLSRQWGGKGKKNLWNQVGNLKSGEGQISFISPLSPCLHGEGVPVGRKHFSLVPPI